VLAPLWFLAGFGGVPTVFLVRDWAQARPYQHTVAPAEVWGGWLFAVVGAALAATYLVAALVQRRLHET
jgi:hypothetical protein